jgi:predicted lipid-binding transport protein (Tim44 family)
MMSTASSRTASSRTANSQTASSQSSHAAAYAAASEEYVDAAMHYNSAMTAATALREAYYAAVAAELKALCDKETKRRLVEAAAAECKRRRMPAGPEAYELEEGEIVEAV